MTFTMPDLVTALHLLATGTRGEQLTALRWLRADALPVSTFDGRNWEAAIQQQVPWR